MSILNIAFIAFYSTDKKKHFRAIINTPSHSIPHGVIDTRTYRIVVFKLGGIMDYILN